MEETNEQIRKQTGSSSPEVPKTERDAPEVPEAKEPRKIQYWFEIGFWILGMAAIHSVLLASTYHAHLANALDSKTAGEFGDFIGGYVGQIIALTGLCFLIATFRTEFSRSRHERFETKYFELLQLHRNNIEEMEIQTVRGRRVFVLMLEEWRCILNVARSIAQQTNQNLTQLQLLQIAYYVLFYGVGRNSTRMLKASLRTFDEEFVNTLTSKLDDDYFRGDVRENCGLPYSPFEGHQSRLGHYYRHFFQMVRYVEDRYPRQMDVQEYMRTIRAQLSTHEQALLLLNSLTPMGAEWWNKHLIDKYRMVHNIPELFFDLKLELDPALLLGAKYFEKPAEHDRSFKPLSGPFRRSELMGTPIWKAGVPYDN